MSVDLPDPDGPMIAAKRPAGNVDRDAGERLDSGLALAVAPAQVLAPRRCSRTRREGSKRPLGRSVGAPRPPRTRVRNGP